MTEIVYILTNEAMPGLIKIGKTGRDDLATRIRELYQTGVPLPFEVFFACEVKDSRFVEQNMHDAFDDHRISKRREFFRLAPERAKAALLLAMEREIKIGDEIYETKEDKQDVEIAKRRSRFQFSIIDIPIGSELKLYRNLETTCVTRDDKNKVDYKGQITSLSDAAVQAFRDLGYRDNGISGPWEWAYNGDRLDDLRRRKEEYSDQ